MSDPGPTRRALVIETDPLVSERLRYLMRAEDLSVCAVDEWLLFRALVEQPGFHLFAVSDGFAERADTLELLRKLEPLLVLVSSTDAPAIARLRMALPGAVLLERTLRDPDAVRRALGHAPRGSEEHAQGELPGPSAQEWVRRAFEPFSLSQRQLEVLALALRGDTSREIAGSLYISEPTVRNHLHAIYERLQVSGRRELLGRFVRGLMDAGAATAASGTRSARGAGGR